MAFDSEPSSAAYFDLKIILRSLKYSWTLRMPRIGESGEDAGNWLYNSSGTAGKINREVIVETVIFPSFNVSDSLF